MKHYSIICLLFSPYNDRVQMAAHFKLLHYSEEILKWYKNQTSNLY